MKVYGIAVLTYNEDIVNGIPDVSVRVFGDKTRWEIALEEMELTEDQEVSTFETEIE